jgi:outer membrane protein TolC
MIRNISILAMLSLSMAASSQSLPLSLKEAQAMAIDSSYAMRDSRYNTEKKIKEVKEVLAIGFPQINGGVEYQNFLELPVNLIPNEFTGGEPGTFTEVQFGVPYNLTASITASQLIFDGTYIVGLKASKTVVELSRNLEGKTAQQIRIQVAEAYHTALLAEENLKLLTQNLENINKTLSDTRATFEAGLTEEQDVDQLMLNKNQIEINIDNSRRFLEIATQTLNFVIGLRVDMPIVLTDKIETLVSLNSSPEYLQAEPNYETHPDMLLAKSNLEIGNLNLRGQKAAYYPNLSAFFTHQQNAQRNSFNFASADEPWFPATIVGVNLKVPIFSSFQRNARVSQAEIGLKQNALQLLQTEENLKLEVTRARSNFDNSLKTWNNQKQSIALAQRILNNTSVKYSEGIAGSFELNVAQSQLLNEQSKFIQAAFDLLSAKQQLDRALNTY